MKMKMAFHSKMSKKSFKDYFLKMSLNLETGPNLADDNPRKLKQTIRRMCGHGAVSTRILEEIYSYRTDVVFSSMTNFRDIQNS